MTDNFRSDLAKAKNLGSAGSGSHHWLHQRFTAIFILLLTSWFFYFSMKISQVGVAGIVDVISEIHNIALLSLFVIIIFYHATLGLQVIIEDYIHCRVLKLVILMTLKILVIITIALFLVSIIYVMIL